MVDTRYGVFDYVQLSVWYITLFGLINQLGWIYGFVAYLVVTELFKRFLILAFGIELMGPGDECFFLDDERSCMNIIVALRMDRFKAQDCIQAMTRGGYTFPRIRSKVVKCFGKFAFKDMGLEAMKSPEYIKKAHSTKTGIHTEQELADFMAKE